MNPKYRMPLISAVVVAVLLVMSAGINNAGNRTVVQYPTGTLLVKFSPGIYMKWFGTVTEYRDVLTYDFDKTESAGASSISQIGIPVRYQDGGTGKVYGLSLIHI